MLEKLFAIKLQGRLYLAGCGIFVATLLASCLLIFGLTFYQDRQAGQYPDSTVISTHNNYSGLPFHYRWDNSYATTDNFTKVYNWYSLGFDLGAEARAMGDCIMLEGEKRVFFAIRYTTVLLCNTPASQMIYVTRSTSFR